MFKEETAMMRDYIASHGDEWESIVEGGTFRDFFKVKGSSLKNVPAGYDREHPQATYLK